LTGSVSAQMATPGNIEKVSAISARTMGLRFMDFLPGCLAISVCAD
jgi:hypothetical protein